MRVSCRSPYDRIMTDLMIVCFCKDSILLSNNIQVTKKHQHGGGGCPKTIVHQGKSACLRDPQSGHELDRETFRHDGKMWGDRDPDWSKGLCGVEWGWPVIMY